jgi:hypothetical protein
VTEASLSVPVLEVALPPEIGGAGGRVVTVTVGESAAATTAMASWAIDCVGSEEAVAVEVVS